MREPLVVTGAAAISALGETAQHLLDGLDRREHGFTSVPPEALPSAAAQSQESTGWAARVASFDVGRYVPPMKARRLDRASLFAVVAARQALEHGSLWPLETPWPERLGVILGTASAGSGPLTEFLRVAFSEGPSMAPPAEFPNTVANAPASQVSILNKIIGPNTTLSQKQSVLGSALHFGEIWLADGRCDGVLVGASDEWNAYYELGYRRLRSLRGSVSSADDNGFLLGEGAAVLLLEKASTAAARQVEPIARVLGVGVTSSPGPTYEWIADSPAMARSISLALDQHAVRPADIGTVLTSANGVRVMEQAEQRALETVLGKGNYLVSGIKGAIGESAAAAVSGMVVAALCRRRGRWIPHGLGTTRRSPGRLAEQSEPMPDGATLVLTSSAGGNYAAVVLG